jgi:hypothetical protein
MEDLYEILEEQVLDQLGGIINPQKKSLPNPNIMKVQQKDFDSYVLKIRKVFLSFQHQ